MNHFLQYGRLKRRVLAVDDEKINRELLQAILSMNYDVTSVTNGKEAMEALYAAEEPYSLILLDLLMPQMSGFQVIEACKADEKLRNIPIIVMTSEKSAEVRSIRMGASDFITKPYRMPEVILARCERIIELSEEKRLIRSIEKDKATGLYIKVFFDAYIKRLLPSLNCSMDAVVLKLSGVDEGMLSEAARLFNDIVINDDGLACRADNYTFYAFCHHQDDYDKLIGHMQGELSRSGNVRIKAGVFKNVDLKAPVDSWFKAAEAACGTANGAVVYVR